MTPQSFIAKWNGASGSERANYQLFFNDLCELLGVDKPLPAQANDADNAYVFERHIDALDESGAGAARFIDTYKRGHFICESKSFHLGRDLDAAANKLIKAKAQAESYARNLPASEPRPVFLMVANVGRFIALYAQFRDNDRSYEYFPDRASYRIAITDLAHDAVRDRLKRVFTEPAALDPARIAARVTREVAAHLGQLARGLEADHEPHAVAGFLTRCLFTMFAEDVGLLPAGGFTDIVVAACVEPASFKPSIEELWQKMDSGGYSVALRKTIPHFNGKLFKIPVALELTRPQLETLLAAARADWKHVEPAIFGTLIERALDPAERHALGAHFTPRAYVERLVLPTLVEPLRADWLNVQTAALALMDRGDAAAALKLARGFHQTLCATRVLDPACGSGNFLYVALEHLKRLEAEVLELLGALQSAASKDGTMQQQELDTEGLTVDPHQFLGLERNPRAAAVAELVLWIGHLQWHFRNRGHALPPTPVLRDFKNIECRDAVLDWRRIEAVQDEAGQPLTRWDGVSFKPHPVTGKPVPDESARAAVVRYLDPHAAVWPAADFVVGNPPFIGASTLRQALGDGYVDALRQTHPGVPESADLVMFWWDHAARLLRENKIRRFGFITTNSLTQTFNRRVLEQHLDALHLAWAIADHPWVDEANGAAVRVAMTVAAPGAGDGRLLAVSRETPGTDGEIDVELAERSGAIHANLRVGANVAAAVALRANGNISSPGFKLHGAGFIVTPDEAAELAAPALIRPYRNGRDITDKPRGVLVIDAWGYDEATLRAQYPTVWQWLLDRVKPERDHNQRATYRDNWWLFGEPRRELRKMFTGLPRYIATVETAKHRVFQFLDAAIAPDNKLICIAHDDAWMLGVLSSRVHVAWALAAGGRLGVGNDPRYNKGVCFEKFPFPAATPDQQATIRDLAERLDAHRKRQQAMHPELTLTGVYNVREKLRTGEPLTAKDKTVYTQGLVGVLNTLHDELDAAVLAAYGWDDAPDDSALLERLVALNAERATEEAAGQVRFLRPAYQAPAHTTVVLDLPATDAPAIAPVATRKPVWPAALPDQLGALARLLSDAPQTPAELAAGFDKARGLQKALPGLLDALVDFGRAQRLADGRYRAG
ncbi:MAG TPA: hypothetical protein PL023_04305 [Thiobacillus sp.]|nr:hypothetical protein [Thiobacillus sp.]